MEYRAQVEKISGISRRLTIHVPAQEVNRQFERGLIELQKTAKLKGFRPGQAPLSVIRQYYSDDVKHRVYHHLVDRSFQLAIGEHQLKTVGSPQIDTSQGNAKHDHSHDHDHGHDHHHDHDDHSSHSASIQENQDFSYTATVEVLPEFELKNYKGIVLKREPVEVTTADEDKIIQSLRESQAQLVPREAADATAQASDYVELEFQGGLVTPDGVVPHEGMKGTRPVEIGSGSLIPGFEDQLIGLKKQQPKKFRITFPQDFPDAELASKEAEFTVTIQEIKEKKLPELNDELAKQLQYASFEEMREKAKEYLVLQKTQDADQALRSTLIGQLVEKHSFEVPVSLVEAQTRALAQDIAQQMKEQGFDENTIQNELMKDLERLQKRAESQVRSSLILESISEKESIQVSPEELQSEIQAVAKGMKVEPQKLEAFYQQNPGKKEDFVFRIRQEKTVKFLLDQAKIK